MSLPIGVLTDCTLVCLGGLFGTLLKRFVSRKEADQITVFLGFCSIAISVTSIIRVYAMPPVIFSVIIGTVIGMFCRLESKVQGLAENCVFHFFVRKEQAEGYDITRLVTVVVIFCASGFGLYGVLMEGMSGDSSVLLSKAALDFCTAVVFGSALGAVVAAIALPMLLIMLALYSLSAMLGPFISAEALQNFMACGGILTLAAAMRMTGIKVTAITNMVPALVLVIPLTNLWQQLPL